jgi:uncharacterized protein (DUF924 family)
VLSGLTNSYPSMYTSMNLERKRTDRQLDKYIDACAKLKVQIKQFFFSSFAIQEEYKVQEESVELLLVILDWTGKSIW